MSVAIRSNSWVSNSIVPWAALGLCVSVVGVSTVFHDALFHRTTTEATATAAAGPPETSAPASATTVTLPEGKFKVAGIRTEPARVVELPSEVGVPGRIEANPDRRVDIRPRASGVIREVHVLLGQNVKMGDVLAVLDSPDVGTARLNLRTRQRELATARIEAAWKDEVATNVARLVPELSRGVPAKEIELKYADRPLGSNGGLLLQAYTEFEIASHEEEKTTGLHQAKILGEHPYFLAIHTREGAKAKFKAALEQVRYDANQQKLVADQQVAAAEATVIDAAQRLRILGVQENIPDLLAHADEVARGVKNEDVTAYPIVAPFDGTIITKAAVPSQRVELNDVLFSLADLTNVWVVANVYESDFSALPALNGGTIRLTATAYPGRTFEAKLLSVGATVDPTTRTVPMLAETPNPDGILKLGMFVRIVLDTKATEKALTVPTAAVVEIEDKKVVFIPSGKDEHTFTMRPVKLGRESGDRQVVLSGLKEGQPVVSAGAFQLKSELILQNETDED
jgi:RND family efflux transporter MFP subunit